MQEVLLDSFLADRTGDLCPRQWEETIMTPAEIINATGGALSAASIGLAALIWALRRKR